MAKCKKLPPPTCCHPPASSPHFLPSYMRKSHFPFQAQKKRPASLSIASDAPFSFREILHHLPHHRGWGEVAALSLLPRLVSLSDLHDPSPFTLTIYWPSPNILAYQSLLRPTSSSLSGSCTICKSPCHSIQRGTSTSLPLALHSAHLQAPLSCSSFIA